VDDLVRHDRSQCFVQVGAMHAEERRAVEILGHRQLALDFTGVADAVEMGVRCKGALAQHRLDADPAQHLH
jgi:hypothetical protein